MKIRNGTLVVGPMGFGVILGPTPDPTCPGCLFLADMVHGFRINVGEEDLLPLAQLEEFPLSFGHKEAAEVKKRLPDMLPEIIFAIFQRMSKND